MADWRPLTRSGGSRTDVLFDSDGKVIFRQQEETQPLLDMNREMRDCGDSGYSPGGEYKRVASIPATVIAQWLTEGIDIWSGEHQDRVARKLNDPDNFFLRTAPGRLGPVGDGTYR